jgi:Photosynthetic reaction centre cytochrome C subunit
VKPSSLFTFAAVPGLLAAAVLAATTAVQAKQDQPVPQAAPAMPATPEPPQQPNMPLGDRPMRNCPPPTNLKVLPKGLTGREVCDIMEKWTGSLGVHCDTCHVADPTHPGPDGRPGLNYPDDSKPYEQIARLMYTMTQQINNDTINKVIDIDKFNESTFVDCGTCHRGHLMPREFVIPQKAPQGGPGGGSQPAGAMPPVEAPPKN